MMKKSYLLSLLLIASQLSHAQPKAEALLRTEGPLHGMRLNKTHNLLAFTDDKGLSLRILDLKTHEIIEVSPHRVGQGFFWSPDSVRLFYRELIRDKDSITSEFRAYDSYLNRSVLLDTLAGSSGFPSLDPRDYTAYLVHEKGILMKRLEFPGERFGKWQGKKKSEKGTWITSQKSILRLTDMGLTLKPLEDDGSGIESFDISPDGKRIAWSTSDGKVYTAAEESEKATYIGRGRDPSWHPERSLLLFAGAREVGTRIYDYDLRISDPQGKGRFISSTPDRAERWPQWLGDESILFTIAGSTDLWRIPLREELATSQKPEPKR